MLSKENKVAVELGIILTRARRHFFAPFKSLYAVPLDFDVDSECFLKWTVRFVDLKLGRTVRMFAHTKEPFKLRRTKQRMHLLMVCYLDSNGVPQCKDDTFRWPIQDPKALCNESEQEFWVMIALPPCGQNIICTIDSTLEAPAQNADSLHEASAQSSIALACNGKDSDSDSFGKNAVSKNDREESKSLEEKLSIACSLITRIVFNDKVTDVLKTSDYKLYNELADFTEYL